MHAITIQMHAIKLKWKVKCLTAAPLCSKFHSERQICSTGSLNTQPNKILCGCISVTNLKAY